MDENSMGKVQGLSPNEVWGLIGDVNLLLQKSRLGDLFISVFVGVAASVLSSVITAVVLSVFS